MAVDSAKDSPEEAKATLLSACDYGEFSSESSTVKHRYFTQAIMDIVNPCNFQITHPDLLSQLLQKVNGYAGGSQTPPPAHFFSREYWPHPAGTANRGLRE